jgi:hypothetical protein
MTNLKFIEHRESTRPRAFDGSIMQCVVLTFEVSQATVSFNIMVDMFVEGRPGF